MPGTLDTVKTISNTAQSLSQVAASVGPSHSETDRRQAFENLAIATGDFLFPITHGRDRVIVVVPPDQVPKVQYFPEWMKMATLSRILLPVGWHWQDSYYSACYRDAVTRLDARAITALDAKWVIISNLFQKQLPPEVRQALSDSQRFVSVARFREGEYYMIVFKVRP